MVDESEVQAEAPAEITPAPAPVGKKKPAAAKAEPTVAPTEEPAAFADPMPLGAAFDLLAALVGDNHRLFYREIPVDGDIGAAVSEIAEEVLSVCPPGRSPQIATFDMQPAGASLFIGARVRFV